MNSATSLELNDKSCDFGRRSQSLAADEFPRENLFVFFPGNFMH
jgi:hypothetical protein